MLHYQTDLLRLIARLRRLAEFQLSVQTFHHKLVQGGKEATDLDSRLCVYVT